MRHVGLQEFEFETQRMKTGKQRSTPWGSTIRQAPPILHGRGCCPAQQMLKVPKVNSQHRAAFTPLMVHIVVLLATCRL